MSKISFKRNDVIPCIVVNHMFTQTEIREYLEMSWTKGNYVCKRACFIHIKIEPKRKRKTDK